MVMPNAEKEVLEKVDAILEENEHERTSRQPSQEWQRDKAPKADMG
jgi:hypothetical protein